MRERGVVSAIRPGEIDVRMSPSSDCSDCGRCAGTGGERRLEGVRDQLGAALGDTVEIETSPRAHRRALLILYGAPVLALLTGYMAGYLLGEAIGFDPDSLGAVLALAFGAIVFLMLRHVGDRVDSGEDTPRVRAIIARSRDGK